MTTKKFILFVLVGVIIIASAVTILAIILSGSCRQGADENLSANTPQSDTDKSEGRDEQTDTSVLENNEEKTVVYFFWGEGCPYCSAEKPFLEEMEQKYPDLEVKMYETWNNQENNQLFQEVAEAYGIQAQGVPATFIGDFEPIVGYAEYMADDLEDKIKTCIDQGCSDPGDRIK